MITANVMATVNIIANAVIMADKDVTNNMLYMA